MKTFLMSAEVNCGVTYEVEAETYEKAKQIVERALIDHIEQGCDGVEVNSVAPLPNDADGVIGVRMPNHDEPHQLEYYDRE